MKLKMFSTLFFLGLYNLFSQSIGTWTELETAPIVSRYNDVAFINPQLGFTVNGWGQIYKTDDGGQTWFKKLDQEDTPLEVHFRSVAFFNAQNGWAGNVGIGEFGATDTTVLYRTEDGGESWQGFNVFNYENPADRPFGICGMHVVNDSTIVAVGRVRGPAHFMKTTDSGKTWTSKDLSGFAAGLIDVKFFGPDTGFAVGLTNPDHEQSSGVVLATTDGGENWTQRFVSSRTAEWFWKLEFPSRKTGYASLQRNSQSPIYFLKTSDGGQTWEEKLFRTDYYFVQGIGFITDNVGWIGGNSSNPTYETIDGGDTWYSAEFGSRVNRLTFFGDTLGYAVGRTVYKFSGDINTSISNEEYKIPVQFNLKQNYPNPFNPSTVIEFTLTKLSKVNLKIYNLLGEEIRSLLDSDKSSGVYKISWDGRDFNGNLVSTGVYVYRLVAENQIVSRKMLFIK